MTATTKRAAAPVDDSYQLTMVARAEPPAVCLAAGHGLSYDDLVFWAHRFVHWTDAEGISVVYIVEQARR